MKKIMIATAIVAATFAVKANAQVDNSLVERLVQKADTYLKSEGKKTLDTPTYLASQKSNIYDSGRIETSSPIEGDSLIASWGEEIKRNPTSGLALGPEVGFLGLDGNPSFAVGGHLTHAWKVIELNVGALAAWNKQNSESARAGETFFSALVYGELGVQKRFALGSYNNKALVAFGAGYAFIRDMNSTHISDEIIPVQGGYVKTSSDFDVEGNSSAIYLYAKYRMSLKHMGGTALSFKLLGGRYNRYYKEGSRGKFFFGATASLEFSCAKKRVDKDVVTLRETLERGDYTLINKVTNKLRENIK